MNTRIINFFLNKVFPYICILTILFTSVGLSNLSCYLIIPFVAFIDKYSFRTGYAVAFYEHNNINLNNPPN